MADGAKGQTPDSVFYWQNMPCDFGPLLLVN